MKIFRDDALWRIIKKRKKRHKKIEEQRKKLKTKKKKEKRIKTKGKIKKSGCTNKRGRHF